MATLAARPMWPQSAADARSMRGKPAEPLILRSHALELVLDRKDGLPYEYHLLSGKSRFIGEDLGAPLRAITCDRARWVFRDTALAVSGIKSTSSQADFHFNVTDENNPIASFVLRYVVNGATVYITLNDVQEHEGYDLIQVECPRLVTVREEDGTAWLAHGDTGGSLVSLAEATPGHLRPNNFWGNVLATLPVVMVGTNNALCVQEVTAYMDETALTVDGEKGKRRASLGTVKVHRVNGSLSYDMNTGTAATQVAGNRETPNLLIGQKPACRLDFIPGTKAGAGWMDGAKLVRQRMPSIPTHYYDDKLVYGIHCDEPKYEKPPATFQQCAKLIRDVAALTDSNPQVVHLWGWQYRGKDTGYPAVAEVNKRAGSYDELMQLMQNARGANCNVTFSDNYDDAYKSSPAWDPKLIAKRPDGELWESRNWTGENSYIIGLAKYMQGPGVERVRYTCERYKLRRTTHVDVLSYYSIRNDWDRTSPASGIKNLVEGRYRVIEEFAKHGIDVSSEALRYAFVGKMSYYWHMPTPSPCPFGGKPIPLLPMIYRQSAIWGDWGRNREYPERLLNMLFYNACPHLSITTSSSPAEITDLFYLMMVPWFKLQSRNIESFRREGERTIIGLQGNTEIDLDWQNKTYKVMVDGVEIARDGSVFCPLDNNRIAFYSNSQKELTAPLPKGWKPATITARVLTTRASQEIHATVDGDEVRVTVPAQQPVIVYRDHKEQASNG